MVSPWRCSAACTSPSTRLRTSRALPKVRRSRASNHPRKKTSSGLLPVATGPQQRRVKLQPGGGILPGQIVQSNLLQQGRFVVGQGDDVLAKAAAQTGVGGQHFLHLFRVAGQHHGKGPHVAGHGLLPPGCRWLPGRNPGCRRRRGRDCRPSSINRMPPMAFWIWARVLVAVWPM